MANEGSNFAETTSSEAGLRSFRNGNSTPSCARPGNSAAKSLSNRRTSALTACGADTQWMVPFTFRPSGALPPFVAGS